MNTFLSYFATVGPAQLVGVAGFICYIVAFGAVQFGVMDGNSTSYSLANILAASLVAVSLTAEFNLSSALIQGSWIVIGTAGLSLRAARSWASTRAVLATTLDGDLDGKAE